METVYIVYVKVDSARRITDIDSSASLSNTDGWIEIDRGFSINHKLAQNNYLKKPLRNELFILRYKLVDGKPVERTQEEIDADIAALPPPPPSQAERIKELENQLAAYEAAYTQGVNEAWA